MADTTIYHFGDTVSVSDGMFEFTPVFEGFTAKLANWPDKDFMTPDGQFSGQTPYEASEEKVMMYFPAQLTMSVSQKKMNSSDTILPLIIKTAICLTSPEEKPGTAGRDIIPAAG